jgi:hypothetical protein
MHSLSTSVRPAPGWHLLALVLAGLLLVLFCPGRAASEIKPSSDVLVPYIEVDLTDPLLGLTTLFAVANAGDIVTDDTGQKGEGLENCSCRTMVSGDLSKPKCICRNRRHVHKELHRTGALAAA